MNTNMNISINTYRIRRPFGSGRVEPSSNLRIFKSSNLQIFKSSNLPSVFLFFASSEPPTPREEVYLPPYQPPGHQLASPSGGRTSSEPTFFDVNFRIDSRYHFDHFLTSQSSKSKPQNEPKWLPKSPQVKRQLN